MMKRYLILTVAMAVVASGCRRDDSGTNPAATDYEVIVESSFKDNGAVKVSRAQEFEDFADGAKVGLFMVDFSDASTHGILKTYARSDAKPDGNAAHNVLYVASNGILSTMPAVHYTKDLAFNVDLFAYYPHTDNYGAPTSMATLPFAVLQNQSTAVNVANSDLCWSRSVAAGIAPSPNPVALQFYHKMAKIKVVILVPAAVSGLAVADVVNFAFQDIKTDLTLNMTTGVTTTLATPSKIITPLNLENKIADGANTRYTYEMIAPAQTYSVGSNLLSFELVLSDGSNKTITYQVPEKLFDTYDLTSQAGMIHNIKLTLLGNEVILLSGSDIEPWIVAPTHTGDLTNKITTRFTTATTYTTANRVKVTTDEVPVKTYDVKNSDVAGSVAVAAGNCTFYFTDKSGSPYDYGFKITKIEFFNGETSLGSKAITAGRVYSTTTMTL